MQKRLLTLLILVGLSAFACSKKEPQAEVANPALTPSMVSSNPDAPSHIGSTSSAAETPSGASADAIQAPSETETPEPLEYVMDDIKGTVMVIPAGKTVAEPAEAEEVVGAGDEVITKADSEASLTLNDNTMVHLSPNSDVMVSELKPNTSNGFLSRLKLMGGKILSEVEKLSDSKSEFEVEAGGVVCGVRGTAFEVENAEGQVSTSTFHGIVEMKKDDKIQQVKANEHSAFVLKRLAFLSKRQLNLNEQGRYKSWAKARPVIMQRRLERVKALRDIAALPPDQRAQMRQQLRQARPGARLKMMHQMMREKRFSPQSRRNGRQGAREMMKNRQMNNTGAGRAEKIKEMRQQRAEQIKERMQERANSPRGSTQVPDHQNNGVQQPPANPRTQRFEKIKEARQQRHEQIKEKIQERRQEKVSPAKQPGPQQRPGVRPNVNHPNVNRPQQQRGRPNKQDRDEKKKKPGDGKKTKDDER